MRLRLPSVTLLSADTINPQLAARALERCIDACDFYDVLFLTDDYPDKPFNNIKINPINNVDEYSSLMVKEVPSLLNSDHLLVIQWDGYITHPGVWRSEFLDFDYIGARWPWLRDGHAVGNGGFSLRSRKLLDALGSLSLVPRDGEAEDLFICRTLRPTLEKRFDIRFAPEAVADAFSYEYVTPSMPTFGFHGLKNMPREINDADMEQISHAFSNNIYYSPQYLYILIQYGNAQNFDMVSVLSSHLFERSTVHEVFLHFCSVLQNDVNAKKLMSLCLRTLASKKFNTA